MTQRSESEMEQLLVQQAAQLRYPPTPDLTQAVQRHLHGGRRLAPRPFLRIGWFALALLIVLITLFSVPPLRAAILDLIRIGAVEIGLPARSTPPVPATTSAATATPRSALLPLKGQTTLAAARQRIPWTIKLPSEPPDLGEPDAVYVQSLDGEALILVWMEQQNPSQVRLSLHMLTSARLVWKKVAVEVVQETTVNQQVAYWTTGPYLLEMQGEGIHETRLIDGHVLIWEEAGITYRLECDLSLEAAVRIAESLR